MHEKRVERRILIIENSICRIAAASLNIPLEILVYFSAIKPVELF